MLAAPTASAFAVQHAEQSSPGATFLSTSLPSPSGLGNLIMVGVFHFAGGSVSSVSDTTGTSYQLVASAVGSAGFAGATLSVYSGMVPAAVAAPNAVVITGPFGAYVEVVVVEYAGLPGAAADLTDTSPAVPGAMTLTGPTMNAGRDDLLFWWLACEGALTDTDGGFTLRANINGDIAADLFAPGLGAYAPIAFGACNTTISILVRIPARLAVDAGVADAGSADAGPFDAGLVDAGLVDAGADDAGQPDAGPVDAGADDAGQLDAGAADGGSSDAGSTDGGNDAGPGDAGAMDAGSLTDAGLADAGVADGGVRLHGDYVVGCGCGVAPLGTLAFALLFALTSRKRKLEGEGRAVRRRGSNLH